MKKTIALFLTLVMLVGLAACGQTTQTSTPTSGAAPETDVSGDAEKNITIAICVPRLSNPFFGRAASILQAYAETLDGVEVVVYDANDSAATQLEQIENVITKKVDGVLMAPVVSDALVPAAEALEEAGIPFVTVDRMVNYDAYIAHVGGDNVSGGRVAAEYIADVIGDDEAKVLLMLGTLGASPTLQREEGFMEVMSTKSNITVIKESANFLRSEGMTVMENVLQANPDIKAVFTQNEEMGLGAIEALQDNGYEPGEVCVVAFDTLTETLAALESGWLQANIEQWPDQQFKTGLDILLAYIKDGTMPAEHLTYLQCGVITKDNISDSEKYEDYLAGK